MYIHCKTQEEWDEITKMYNLTWTEGKWRYYGERSTINIEENKYGPLSCYHDKIITLASEILNKTINYSIY